MKTSELLCAGVALALACVCNADGGPNASDAFPTETLRLTTQGPAAAGCEPTWESLARRPMPQWYADAKFGIFCHWGFQCAAECGDWYAKNLYNAEHRQGRFHRKTYGDPAEFGAKDLIPQWKGEKWKADELCALYKRMGARYIVAMANHHDNFDNWDSTHQPWNSVRMGPKRDVLAEWADAARKNGLRFGESFHAAHAQMWYECARDADGLVAKEAGKGKWWEGEDPQLLYRQAAHAPMDDWRNPKAVHYAWHWGSAATPPGADFVENVRLRMNEAIAKYRPDIIYFDDTAVPFWPVSDAGLRVVADYYNLNPDGVATGKILTDEQRRALVWDVERGTPPTPIFPHWQTDTCIGAWHYDREIYEKNRYKSAARVLQTLADVVSKNGNLCLSIPIRSDGTIDEKERAVCEDIADWMAVNGEAIFDTVPHSVCGEGPQLENAPPLSAQGFNENKIPPATVRDIRYTATKDGRTVYAIVLKPPADGETPAFTALAAERIANVERLKQVKDMPAVFKVTLRAPLLAGFNPDPSICRVALLRRRQLLPSARAGRYGMGTSGSRRSALRPEDAQSLQRPHGRHVLPGKVDA